nr:hypothetical protein StreXyl84_73890 [Streptomyces sp. Xyl84]
MIRRGAGRRAGRTGPRAAGPLTVTTGGERVHLVHLGDRPPAPLKDVADCLGPAGEGEVAVVVGSSLGDGGADALCEQLAPALDKSRKADIRVLRLVMSAGADEAGGRPSVARLLCERWGFDVLATAGAAVVVPDGSLFSPDLPGAPGGWWHFSTGEVPRRVGSRLPVPDWESALERVGREAADGHVVEAVPAGLLVRPAQASAPVVHALPYAVPPDPDRPQVLLGAPSVPAEALADVLAALPGRLRRSVRLLSLDGRDLIGTGQAVADLIGADTQVAHGVPVITERAAPGEASVSLRMVGADGTPSWRPYVESVVCPPMVNGVRPPVRVAAWRAPAGLRREGAEPDALVLDGRWKAAVTPAGLWIGPRSTRPPHAAAHRPVAPDVVAVDLGAPRRALDDSLWPHLDAILRDMEPEERERAVVRVHGVLGANGMDQLRRLAVRHGFSLLAQEPAAGTAEEAGAVAEAGPDTVPETEPEGGSAPSGTPGAGGRPVLSPEQEPEPESEQEPVPEPEFGSVPEPESMPGVPLATTSAHTPGAAASPDAPDLPGAPGAPHRPAAAAPSPGRPAYATAGTGATQTSGQAAPPRATPAAGPAAPPSVPRETPSPASTEETWLRSPARQASSPQHGPVPQRAVPPSRPQAPPPDAQSDHDTLRASLGPFWERHTRAALQAMTRMPGMRAQDSGDVSLTHLAAVHVYLTAVDESELGASVTDGDESTLALLRCLEWGLRRLPSYRGAVVSVSPQLTARLTPDLVGARLDGEFPVRGTAAGAGGPAPATDHVLIWSVTGRRASALLNEESREIVFSRHSGFRFLGVARRGPATVGLLRELPPHDRSSGTTELTASDVALLERLRAAVDLSAGPAAHTPTTRPAAAGAAVPPHTGTA